MRKLLTYLFLYCLVQANAWAQERPLQAPPSSGESIVLHCDREIYGLNEQIHYFASYTAPEELEGTSFSSVLYVELISWDGTKHATSKVLIESGGAIGKIRIPENIPSGVYYLRAYTLWMRNYHPLSYAYLPLKILNPYSQELLARPQELIENPRSMEHKLADLNEDIIFSGLMDQYGTSEHVDFEIKLADDLPSGPYSLGIAKTPGQSSAEYKISPIPETDTGSLKIEFLPEINGLSLSGTLVDSESGKPVTNSRMQVSTYANPFFFAEALTGKDGSFLYAFPHFTGNPELHITEATDSLLNHTILLATEFCSKPVLLPYIALQFDSAEQSIVKEILLNTQLKDRYRGNITEKLPVDSLSAAFYGNGASVTYVRDYIELSSLREFIFEIIPQVSIQSNNKGSSISIQGPSCMDIYPPLILMDNVPVPNNDELLNIPSMRIERIEALNQAYMVGNTRYSGILSIYSTKKDMSGLAQEEDRHFFNFQMLDDGNTCNEYEASSTESFIPEIRNLLYWEPSVNFTEEGSFRVIFSTPDTPGQYVISLRGTKPENRTNVLGKALILVK